MYIRRGQVAHNRHRQTKHSGENTGSMSLELKTMHGGKLELGGQRSGKVGEISITQTPEVAKC